MPPRPTDHCGQRRTLAVAAAGTFLVLVAFTAPLATLVSTARGLAAGPGAQAWLLSSMSVGLGVGLLPSGAIADDHGRRRAFLAGTGLLAAASVACAVATGPPVFIAARIAQGLGGAAILACSLGLIAHAFPGAVERARATGVWGASVGAGVAVGPLAAGGLDQGPGWRASHWLIAGMAIWLTVAGWSLVESRAEVRRRVDVVGVLLLGGGLACLLSGLVEARQQWHRPLVAALFGAGGVLVAAFAVAEHRVAAPMLDPALFRRPEFVAVTTAALATGLGIIAQLSFLTVVVERGLHGTSLDAAIVLLGWSGTSTLTALAARRLPAGVSTRWQLAAGLLVVAAGQLALVGLDTGSSVARLLPGLLIAGVASGVINAALGRGAVTSVPAGRASVGSGANNTARYVGSALGITIVAVIAARPDPVDLVHGWNLATVVTASFTVLGAAAVLACRPTPAT